ncbi:MAG: heme exporter protein [Solirubrobacterales bacterium]|jgi:heme exporter protein A|nr:heme exporter protein [Solirubrobacterales bacterium]MDX6663657.1 heme exporter protein [Solirubrobacterales bacterium]
MTEPPAAPPALELRDLGRDYGERTALHGVSLDLAAGQTLAVLGPNGAGKTTLLRLLATLLSPTAGEVVVLGCELPRRAWQLRGRVGYLGHDPLLYRDLTGRENLVFSARLHGIERADAGPLIDSLLERTGMARRADDRVGELSAGMRQRLAICRCLLHDPDLLLLDEPTAHLDPEGRELAEPLLAVTPTRSRVIVSHDPERALAAADRALVLAHGGGVAYEGPAAGAPA